MIGTKEKLIALLEDLSKIRNDYVSWESNMAKHSLGEFNLIENGDILEIHYNQHYPYLENYVIIRQRGYVTDNTNNKYNQLYFEFLRWLCYSMDCEYKDVFDNKIKYYSFRGLSNEPLKKD